MKTRYSIQYWWIDEHDCLVEDFDTLKQARDYIKTIDLSKYKDILLFARHWRKVNNPFEYNGSTYDWWEWELIDDDYFKEYSYA